MMEMTVDCPGCGAALKVPETSSGRRARCPACHIKFVIPSAKELLEETISHWIVEDLDKMQDQGEAAKGAAAVRAKAGSSSSGGTLMGVPAMHDDMNHSRASGGTTTVSPQSPKPAPPPERPNVPSDELPPATEAFTSSAAADPFASGSDIDTLPDASGVDAAPDSLHSALDELPPAVSLPAAPAKPTANLAYPRNFDLGNDRPYLIVANCSQSGVDIEFDSRWFKHESFRASLPMRCVYTGVGDRSELTGRPMIYQDHYKGHDNKSVHAIEAMHERRPTSMQSERDLLHAMRIIDDITPPFNLPMPYYVSRHHGNRSLQCKARRQIGASTVCEIQIPDGRVALEWVARVNGICGPEYELLQSDVAMHGSDAWRQLPEKTRERLEVWCKFKPRESFRLYINDADFSSADAGLAGVVITDQRLIYHKYHHSGSFPLNREGTLHVKTDGKIARLALAAKGRLARVGKINMKKMTELIQTLAEYPKLKIQLASGSE